MGTHPIFESDFDCLTDHMTDSRSSLIAVVLDLNPLAWGLRTVIESQHAANQERPQKRAETIVQGLDAVLTFINSFLLMTHGNQVAVVGVHPFGSEFLHPTAEYSGNTASRVNKQVEQVFRRLLGLSDSNEVDESSAGLLLDARLESTSTDYSSKFSSGLAKALCFINRKKAQDSNLAARCLAIKCGADFLSNQYLALTNASFAAEALKVSIDTVVLDRENDVPSLQQMAELTNGIYSRVREPPMLLQTLLTYHLADDTTRHLLAAIPQKLVDGRAICFTTREIVDIGFVCSVCLSVFKSFLPICSTCDSVFKLPASRKRKRER